MKIVYILGAGASKDFGLPLGNEIYDYAYKILALKKEPVYNELKTVICEVEKHLKRLFINLSDNKLTYPPFEEVLTLVWDTRNSESFDYNNNMLKTIFEAKYGAQEVLSTFIRMLGLTIVGCMMFNHHNVKIDAFRRYVKSLDFTKNDISFITLNYDLLLDNILIECANEGIIEDFTYGVPLADAALELPYPNRNRESIRDKGIVLLKPHGSVNLVYCSFHKQATYGEGYFCLRRNNDLVNSINIKCPSCGTKTKPLIIPPLYNKRDFIEDTKPKSQRLIWRSTPHDYRTRVDYVADKILREADQIVVIGYSMPAYDYDFKTLLITNLMLNKNRKQVHLKIITKGLPDQIQTLVSQYKFLVGKVTVECTDGLFKYLKRHRI
jgi:hypothetical protein